MSSSEFVHVIESFTIKPDMLQEFFNAVNPVIMKLEKTDPHVWHIYAIHTQTQDGLDQIVFVEKFSNEEAMERYRGSPPFVAMSKAISPLLEGPPEVKYGPVVLGFQDRQR